MKNENDLNSELTIVALIFVLIIISFIYVNSRFNEYMLLDELNTNKEVINDQLNENNKLYNIISYLNVEITTKNEELQEYEDLKQLKDDVREFWNK